MENSSARPLSGSANDRCWNNLIEAHTAGQAIEGLLDLRLARYPHFVLLSRVWQLRQNFSASYDAVYLALAEKLGATLITHDARLASSSGQAAAIELF
jgi:predicted nucleic acid-binding protein